MVNVLESMSKLVCGFLKISVFFIILISIVLDVSIEELVNESEAKTKYTIGFRTRNNEYKF